MDQIRSILLSSRQLYSWSIFNAAGDRVWGKIGANAEAFTVAVAIEGFFACFFGSVIEKVLEAFLEF